MGLLANFYLQINAPSEFDARQLMFDYFGPKWSGLYSEQEFEGQAVRYNLKKLAVVDQYGNKVPE